MAKKRKNNNYIGTKSYYAREAARKEKEMTAMRRKLAVIVSFILVIVLVVTIPFATVGIVREYKTNKMGTGHADEALMSRDISKRDVKFAEFTIENYGKFVVLLDATAAPKTVENFVNLVEEGFYDGITFHRANSTIIQGGDPLGNGTGGSGKNIKGEFYKNGHTVNNISHKRGVISMARSGNDTTGFDTASSQFFICVSNYTSWDTKYAAFGYVVEGMSVVDAVNAAMVKKTAEGKDVIEDIDEQPVIRSIRILDNYTFTHEH